MRTQYDCRWVLLRHLQNLSKGHVTQRSCPTVPVGCMVVAENTNESVGLIGGDGGG